MHKKYTTPSCVTNEKIKEIRKNIGLTQKEFAELVGCSKPTVERWEISDKAINGPIALVIDMLERHPEYVEELRIPEQEYPLRMLYMYKDKVCTLIDVDEMRRKIRIVNYIDHIMFRAFGVNEHPTYEEYEQFLESRCFPRERDKMKLMLRELDIPYYDPMLIIERTQGRMAEDDFWLKIEMC